MSKIYLRKDEPYNARACYNKEMVKCHYFEYQKNIVECAEKHKCQILGIVFIKVKQEG